MKVKDLIERLQNLPGKDDYSEQDVIIVTGNNVYHVADGGVGVGQGGVLLWIDQEKKVAA